MNTIITETNYKKLIRLKLNDLKEKLGKKFNFQNLANACRVQKTYLSKVLNENNGKSHLSSDQLFAAAKYLKLNIEEERYMLLLAEWDKSDLPERKTFLESELEKIRNAARKSERAIEAHQTAPSTTSINEYYLDPFMQLVHMFCLVDRFRNNPEAIARKLGLTKMRLNTILKKLERLNLISRNTGQIEVLQKSLHLSSQADVYHPYRALLRIRSLDLLQRRSQDSSYSFSVIFTASKETRGKIHDEFLAFLKQTQAKVQSDKNAQKEVFQLNFDLLDWSE